MTEFGFCFDRTFPPAALPETARRMDDAGVGQLWVIEDCFYTAGISLAATALAVTDRLQVGIGILPAVARTPAVTAMEIATLARLAPGRVLAGIGHGVQDWMEQMGARPTSPLTTLEQTLTAVRSLLHGETVSMAGPAVHMRNVTLHEPPDHNVPVLAGVQGPRSLALAGRVADGVILPEGSSAAYIRWALGKAGRDTVTAEPDTFAVATYVPVSVSRDRLEARRQIAPWIARLIEEPSPGISHANCFAEMRSLFDDGGVESLVSMPDDFWSEVAGAGTPDDVAAHAETLTTAGATHLAFFPVPDLTEATAQYSLVVDEVLPLLH